MWLEGGDIIAAATLEQGHTRWTIGSEELNDVSK